ncbi:hypothetical protein WJX84_000903 [Apatococcus fuscideae]|uniref:Uncharacterized protein n=1 Tax=Apatococcus fuscideae TaxID=2026836 RepID=A0AAW1SRT6_9CHLO
MSGSKAGHALGTSQDSLYLQIAVHAFGIALAVVIGLVLLSVWNLLKEFREPMLWALLCSVALRDAKEVLIEAVQSRLQSDSSLAGAVCALLLLPLQGPLQLFTDVYHVSVAWRQILLEDFSDGFMYQAADPHQVPKAERTRAMHAASFARRDSDLPGKRSSALARARHLLNTAIRAFRVAHTDHVERTGLRRAYMHRSSSVDSMLRTAAGVVVPPDGKRAQAIAKANRRAARVKSWNRRAFKGCGAKLREYLGAQVAPIVTSALICALLIGPVLLSAFLVVQIGQEGRAAVFHFREALPAWSMDNVTDASNGTLGAPGFVQDFLNQEWVRDYRVQAYELMQQQVPTAMQWLQVKADEFVAANNLSAVANDAKMLYATFNPMPCPNSTVHDAMLDKAKASVLLADTRSEHRKLLEVPHEDGTEGTELDEESEAAEMYRMEVAVVDADAALQQHQQAVTKAMLAVTDAEADLKKANELLQQCARAEVAAEGNETNGSNLRTLVEGIAQAAWSRIKHIWWLVLSLEWIEAFQEIKAGAMETASAIQELLQGQEERGELNALQRLGKAAAEPLLRLGIFHRPSKESWHVHLTDQIRSTILSGL